MNARPQNKWNEIIYNYFHGETHSSFFRDIYELLGQHFDNLCVCVISSKCNSDKRIASDFGEAMIGYCGFKRDVEVNRILKTTPNLNKIAGVHPKIIHAAE